MSDYLAPAEVTQLIPGMTPARLKALRFSGKGPRFLKPTPKTVIYRRQDIIDWLNASERTQTGAAA